MKRQTHAHGVVSLWKPASLDVSPFDLPGSFMLQRSGYINRRIKMYDQVFIGTRSILIRSLILGKVVSQKRLPLGDFEGVALRVSTSKKGNGLSYAISVNLHHEIEQYCIPLLFAYDMDITSARLHAWSRTLKMKMLLPALDGSWKEPDEPIGRLVMKPAYQRSARQMLASRKAILPAYRETCQIDLNRKVSGREISAWD